MIINYKFLFTNIHLKEKITKEILEGLEEITTELLKRGELIIFCEGPFIAEIDLWGGGFSGEVNIHTLFPEKFHLEQKLVEKWVI